MKPIRPSGLLVKPSKPKPEPPAPSRFVVYFVVEKTNGDYSECPGLTWEFETFNLAKQFTDKAMSMLRDGANNGSPSRHYPFVTIFDRSTERHYDYQLR